MASDVPAAQPIRLDDHTVRGKAVGPTDSTIAEAQSSSDVPSDGVTKPSGILRPRGDTIRKELARRKYARFREGRHDGEEDEVEEDEEEGEREMSESAAQTSKHKRHDSFTRKLRREAHRTTSLRQKLRLGAKKPPLREKEKEYAVDILYENQRGWFFCGIPLYSSKSLLNFDPGAWQTGEFHDSPVNITNAQVPDPTWMWAWPAWYVDMSRDVDEEGWEYSFGFRQGFAWHGAAPWFSSFVRRRRWLRKRIRTAHARWKHDALHDAHHLNPDYFTIHAATDDATDSSRESSQERGPTTTKRTSTFVSRDTRLDDGDSDSEDELEGITDVNSLLRHLKRTTIDRKKLDAFQHFVADAGAELYYLAEAMPEVIGLFMYQHSRRQAVETLQSALRSSGGTSGSQPASAPGSASLPSPATESSSKDDGNSRMPPFPAPSSERATNLQRALDAVAAHVYAMDFRTPLASPRSPRSPWSPQSRSSGGAGMGIDTAVGPETPSSPIPEPAADHTDPDAEAANDNEAQHVQEQGAEEADPGNEPDDDDDEDDGFPAPHATGAFDEPLPASPTRAADGRRIKGIPASAGVGGDVGLAARMDLAGREEIGKAAEAAVGAAVRRTREREDEKGEE